MKHIEKTNSEDISEKSCPVDNTLSIIGGKWKVLILHHLKDEPRRFNELRRRIPDITQRMLTLQLRELEQDGIILRHVYPQVPPKVEYSLTELGCTLIPVIMAMHEWGRVYGIRLLSERMPSQLTP
ncbi:winged helix-turn-helix transcriptional regulator [Stenoxybacter acetivorans]|uniref:winged helix-turn-helix transcriptional regulator n=1 Tax=Stenoxybacter acetivorans TaxID=422441 RepID=UPI00068CBC91|nr:helix-turn-helix domain-containing protein [Stenoxybacter acetivorans]